MTLQNRREENIPHSDPSLMGQETGEREDRSQETGDRREKSGVKRQERKDRSQETGVKTLELLTNSIALLGIKDRDCSSIILKSIFAELN